MLKNFSFFIARVVLLNNNIHLVNAQWLPSSMIIGFSSLTTFTVAGSAGVCFSRWQWLQHQITVQQLKNPNLLPRLKKWKLLPAVDKPRPRWKFIFVFYSNKRAPMDNLVFCYLALKWCPYYILLIAIARYSYFYNGPLIFIATATKLQSEIHLGWSH